MNSNYANKPMKLMICPINQHV